MHIDGCTIVPAKGSHAVKAAVFVCEFPGPLSSAVVRQVIEHYDSSSHLREIFPEKKESRSRSVSVSFSDEGVEASVEASQEDDVIGVMLQRLASDGSVDLAIEFRANLLMYTCNNYSRWKSVSADALQHLAELAKFAIPESGITVFGLQYVDEFLISGAVDDFTAGMILSDSVSRLPTSVLTQKGSWHNHSGWFEDCSGDGGRILHNMNVSLLVQPESQIFQIIAAHRLFLPRPLMTTENLVDQMRSRFDLLHEANKGLTREILNADAISAIHLS